MNVVVTTIVSLNPGDAAILEGSMGILERAFGPDDLRVTVFDNDGVEAGRRYPWATFRTSLFRPRSWGRIRRWIDRLGYAHRVPGVDRVRYRLGAALMRRGLRVAASAFLSRTERGSLEAYLDADLVIASGGTYLVEHYSLLSCLVEYEFVLGLGKPLVFFPQSLGPFTTTPHRARLRSVFERADRVFVRDARSASHLEALGVPRDGFAIAPDAAFALAPGEGAPGGSSPAVAEDPRPRIAISVREWSHYRTVDARRGREQYVRALAAATGRLVGRHGAAVTFLSTCQGLPEYWTDDSVLAREIVSRLDDEIAASVKVDGRFRQPREVLAAYGRFDGVIATRMHAAILAMCAGTPVLGIAYEFKSTELFRVMGLERWVTDVHLPYPDAFVERVDRFMDALPGIRVRLPEAVAERREAALAIGDALRAALTPPGPERS